MKPSILEVKQAVAKNYGVSVADLEKHRRAAWIMKPRWIAIYLSYELTSSSTTRIGAAFGNRNLGTIIYALDNLKEQFAADPAFEKEVQLLGAVIVGSSENASPKPFMTLIEQSSEVVSAWRTLKAETNSQARKQSLGWYEAKMAELDQLFDDECKLKALTDKQSAATDEIEPHQYAPSLMHMGDARFAAMLPTHQFTTPEKQNGKISQN